MKINVNAHPASPYLAVGFGITKERGLEIGELATACLANLIDTGGATTMALIRDVAELLDNIEEVAYFCYVLGVKDTTKQIQAREQRQN